MDRNWMWSVKFVIANKATLILGLLFVLHRLAECNA